MSRNKPIFRYQNKCKTILGPTLADQGQTKIEKDPQDGAQTDPQTKQIDIKIDMNSMRKPRVRNHRWLL